MVDLIYELSQSKTYYICAGFSESPVEPINLTIPSFYNQKPVKEIKSKAFCNNDCIKSVFISNGITSIGAGAFQENLNLKSITIPHSVYYLGEEAFADCKKLAKINFLSEGNFSCEKNNKIFANAGIDNEQGCELYCGMFVKNIPDRLFCPKDGESAPNLQKITFEKTTIESTEEIITSCSSIGQESFKGCSDLMSLELSNKLTKIDNTSFTGCYRLVEVVNFSNKQFEDIKKDFPRVMLAPQKTSQISFTKTMLEDLDTSNKIGCFTLTTDEDIYIINSERKSNIQFIATNSSYKIADYAFCERNLKTIKMGLGVKSIGNYSFFNNPELVNVTVSSSLEDLGAFVFSQTGIKDNYIQNEKEEKAIYMGLRYAERSIEAPFIHSEAFIHHIQISISRDTMVCPYSFKSVYSTFVPRPITNIVTGNYQVDFLSNAFEGAQFSNLKASGLFEVLEQFPEDTIISAILNSSITREFKQSQLTNLTMTVDTNIADRMLTCWNNIKSATIYNLSSSYDFRKLFNKVSVGLKTMTEIVLNNIQRIGANAFENIAFNTFKMPDSIKTINNNAFLNASITNIYLPQIEKWISTSLGNEASSPFNHNTKIYFGTNSEPTSNIMFADNVKIGSFTFCGSCLDRLYLYNQYLTIGTGAFKNCKITNLLAYEATFAKYEASGGEAQYIKTLSVSDEEISRARLSTKANTYTALETLDLSNLCGYMPDSYLGGFAESTTLKTLYLNSLRQYDDGTPYVSPTENNMFRMKIGEPKSYRIFADATVTPLGRIFSYTTREQEGTYKQFYNIETMLDDNNERAFSEEYSTSYYYYIPPSLETLYICRGYIGYNAFPKLLNVYVGEWVEPAATCFCDTEGNYYDGFIDKKTKIGVLGKEGDENYNGRFICYSDNEIKDLSSYTGIADYTFCWQQQQAKEFNLFDKTGQSNLKYIGTRALAGDHQARDEVKQGQWTGEYTNDNTLVIPPSVRKIGVLAFDSAKCNLLLIPTSVETIASYAFDKIRVGWYSNSSGTSIAFVKPPKGYIGREREVVSIGSGLNKQGYYNNIFRNNTNNYLPYAVVIPREYEPEEFDAQATIYEFKDGLMT